MTLPDFFKKQRSRSKTGAGYKMTDYDDNDQFILSRCAAYILRHLNKYGLSDQESLQFLSWVLGDLKADFMGRVCSLIGESHRNELLKAYPESLSDHFDFSEAVLQAMSSMTRRAQKNILAELEKILGDGRMDRNSWGCSEVEKTAKNLSTLFNLSEQEVELCLFLFITSSYDPPENFFSYHLDSRKFSGRKYLCNALNMSRKELNEAFTGVLYKSEIIEVDEHEVRLSDEFLLLFQNPSAEVFADKFYQKTPKEAVPLDQHFVSASQTAHLERLLKSKPDTSTHILLYGEPGTGKTSFAYGLVKDLRIPSYEISQNADNKSKNRRAAITAALNMTNTGEGSVVIVDESDNILNTRNSWFERGETQDKGYLNQLMEEPGVRMIWICNSIRSIDPSILRRFAFSIEFKPFTYWQRVRLFENIIRANRVKRFFSKAHIEALARKYNVNAGTIDISLKKAIESGVKSKAELQQSFALGLEAYLSMVKAPKAIHEEEGIENNYSLEGLNIGADIRTDIRMLEKFSDHLRNPGTHAVRNMNLLFYGPPGTGKSELARHIAYRLNRKCVCKRLSDILSPYVGVAEKNIRSAFEEAEKEEAVLVLDEADSLLFSRTKAIRSWETSQTNEFLTAMERYKGILICTTNMMEEIDNASIRRFSRKIKFDYLEPEGNINFYKKFLQPLLKQPIDNATRSALLSLKYLTPGDFKTVRDQFAFYPRKENTPEGFLNALRGEVEMKQNGISKKPIGFAQN